MKVLVVNAGSSSLKYQLMDVESEQVIAKGLCDRVGTEGSVHTYEKGDLKKVFSDPLPDHAVAIQKVLDALVNEEYGGIKDISEIEAVGHRVVHGGDHFTQSVIIDSEVVKRIEICCELAPLHNPPALSGIEACQKLMPNLPQVAVFDTSFHQTMPPHAFMYALPYEYYETNKIRRYGFHGTSHRYVAERAAAVLQKPLSELKLITCHLGNGGSITAVDKGKSVDTSMGLTPLEGLVMGTRSGSIDPAIPLFLIDTMKMDSERVNVLLNKESGLLGVSGLSNDLRDILEAEQEGNERAKLAVDMFAYEAKKCIGSYVYALGGVDAIVFTAGVGENSGPMRKKILEGLENLGVEIDDQRNNVRGGENIISSDESAVKVLVIATNEELMIGRDVKSLVKP